VKGHSLKVSRLWVFLIALLLCTADYLLVGAVFNQLPVWAQVSAGFFLSPGLAFVLFATDPALVPNDALLGLVVVLVSALAWWTVAVVAGLGARLITRGDDAL
jgi:hypothetical protein